MIQAILKALSSLWHSDLWCSLAHRKVLQNQPEVEDAEIYWCAKCRRIRREPSFVERAW
jgi:hypothetical protein